MRRSRPFKASPHPIKKIFPHIRNFFAFFQTILLTAYKITYIIIHSRAAMAQSVEHVLGKDEVTSSSLVSSSRISTLFEGAFFFARVLTKDGYAIDGVPEKSLDILGRRSILGVTDRTKRSAALSDG